MSDCVFCRIAAKEIPTQIVYEANDFLAFHDVHPQAPIHIQIITKRHIARVSELNEETIPFLGKLVLAANELARQFQIAESGYRLVINCNPAAGQSVYHLHLHLLGGRPMRWPPG